MPSRRVFLASLDPKNDENYLLRKGLEEAANNKAAFRDALRRAGVAAQIPGSSPFGRKAVIFSPGRVAPAPAADGPTVSNANCTTTFDANAGVTEILASVQVQRSMSELAVLLDPRAWAYSGSVIGASFLVEDDDGEYVPRRDLDHMDLGKLRLPGNKPVLLYEYARSDIASFENILAISKIEVGAKKIHVDYHLYDCLICTFGIFTAPGGLTINEGYSEATLNRDGSVTLEVLKRVKVRDLTPNDPGNKFDFGEAVNDTMGAALSQWVHDTSMMSPVA
jgi:hypothetical protein